MTFFALLSTMFMTAGSFWSIWMATRCGLLPSAAAPAAPMNANAKATARMRTVLRGEGRGLGVMASLLRRIDWRSRAEMLVEARFLRQRCITAALAAATCDRMVPAAFAV